MEDCNHSNNKESFKLISHATPSTTEYSLKVLEVLKKKKSKKQYYEHYFTEHVNNIKKHGIKKIVNVKKNSNRTSKLNVWGKVIDDDKEISTNFNIFFLLMAGLTRRS